METTPNPAPRLRATTAQYGIWIAQQSDDDGAAYLTAELVELEGELDAARLARIVEEVLNHCATLHMRFEWDGQALWQHPQPPALQVPLIDFSAEADPQQARQAWMRRALSEPCDLASQPLCRSALLRTGPHSHGWYLQVHHVALDGFGYSLVQQAVAARWNAAVAGTAPPPLPDWRLEPVVEAEAQYRARGGFEADRDFWREHLRQVPAGAELAPLQEGGGAPRRRVLALEPTLVAGMQAAAREAGCEWSAWMLAAVGLWLGRQSGQRHLTFGIPVMNRMGTPALAVPCMAMNIVPFSVHLAPEGTLRQLAAAAAAQLKAIRPHLYYRYGWIRGDLGLLEEGRFLFNQAVNLMPFDRHVQLAGLQSRMRPVSGGPVKDLNVLLVVEQGRWLLTLEANAQAYGEEQLEALAADLSSQLQDLSGLPADTALARWLDAMPAPSVCLGPELDSAPAPVLDRLRAVAAAAPAQRALEWDGGSLSYAQLLRRVGALAAQLARLGVAPGDTVALLLPRSAEAIVALLATWWVGAACAPLDPEGPARRTRALLAGLRPRLVLSAAAWREPAEGFAVLDLDEPFGADAAPVPCHPSAPHDAACLFHTSGSTGTPKGVRVGHGALAHFVVSTHALYRVTPEDRVLQFAPLHFDASLEEILVTLCHGATLVLRDDAMLDSAGTFAAAVQRLALTVLDLPTAYWHAFTHALDAEGALRLRGLRLVVIGGEAALAERVARWAELLPGLELLNTYGPTEATIIATVAALAGPRAAWRPGEPVPIGLPRPGVQVRVVDERGYPVPAGRTGELAIVGEALALGYLDDPAQTARRFIPLPDTGERAYLTGDRVRLSGGALRFVGRADRQLKIAGLRVDPLEIENALLAVPAVREAAVLPLLSAGDACTLAAFVSGCEDVQALREALRQSLPAAAVPDRWQVLERLPRNANNKIDRHALRALLGAVPGEVAGEGGSATEQVVMSAWRAVLGEQALTPASNFFEIGGKSLQAIQVSSRLAQALQRDVAVSLLFRHATVQSLARALEVPAAHRPPAVQDPFAPLLALQQAGEGAPVLWCLQPAEGLAWSYLRLAPHLPRITLQGLQMDPALALEAPDFEALVGSLLQRLRAVQPQGPYHLLGWSLGGGLAQALAARLAECGERVALLALMDCYPAEAWAPHPVPVPEDVLRTLLGVNGDFDTAALEAPALRLRLLRPGSPFAGLGEDGLLLWTRAALHQMQLFRRACTPRYDAPMVFYRALRHPPGLPEPESWHAHVPAAGIECVPVDCTHDGMSDPLPMARIGADLARRLGGDA